MLIVKILLTAVILWKPTLFQQLKFLEFPSNYHIGIHTYMKLCQKRKKSSDSTIQVVWIWYTYRNISDICQVIREYNISDSNIDSYKSVKNIVTDTLCLSFCIFSTDELYLTCIWQPSKYKCEFIKRVIFWQFWCKNLFWQLTHCKDQHFK